MLKNIPKITVYAALFLIPLLTLPFTANVLDFQKQFFLFGIVSLGVFFWVWNVLSEHKLEINLNPLHFFALGFAAIILISAIFSLYTYGSLWGAPLPVAESFATVLTFVLLYFLIVNNFKKSELLGLIATMAVSGAIAAVYAIFQSFGVYLLPFLDYTRNPSFNTIGTTGSLALFSAILLATIFPLVFVNKNPYRWPMTACGAILFFALVFFNGIITRYFPAKAGQENYGLSLAPWIVLAVSALAVFIFSVSDQKFLNKNSRAKGASFALLFGALIFIIFNIFAKDMVSGIYGSANTAMNVRTSMEASLQQRTSANIALNVLKQSSLTFFLGSGPGTFVYDYVKFKPQQVNQDNIAWNMTFFSGASEVINRVATTGLLGIIALLLVVALWTVESFRLLTGEENEEDLPLAIFGGWLALAAAMFYYPFNLSLAMLFWVFLGLIIALDEKKMAILPLRSVRLTYAVSLTLALVLGLGLVMLVWNAKRYYAEAEYLAAIKSRQSNDIPGAIRHLEAAANSTDRLQDNYLTGLSQIYLAQAQQELNKQGSKPEEAIKAAAPYLQVAVNTAMLSTEMANPNNPANWATRGYIYRQLIGVSEGFDTWALNMYQKALALEPANPTLWTEIGQVYVLQKELAKAKDSFKKAVNLRDQYIDPHYYLALIYDQEGDKNGAIAELEAIKRLLPASDETSITNVDRAIENIKQGKSLSGNAAATQIQQGNPLPESQQNLPSGSEIEGILPPAGGSATSTAGQSAPAPVQKSQP